MDRHVVGIDCEKAPTDGLSRTCHAHTRSRGTGGGREPAEDPDRGGENDAQHDPAGRDAQKDGRHGEAHHAELHSREQRVDSEDAECREAHPDGEADAGE